MKRISKKILLLLLIILAALSLCACGFVSYVEYKNDTDEVRVAEALEEYLAELATLSDENYYREAEKREFKAAILDAQNELAECDSVSKLKEVFERHKAIILAIPTDLELTQVYLIGLMYSYAEENEYREKEKAQVDALTDEYLERIQAATDTVSAERTLFEFQEKLAGIKTHLQLLSGELGEYAKNFGYDIDYSKYKTNEQERITEICSEFREKIVTFTDAEAADKYITEISNLLESIPTKEYIQSELRQRNQSVWNNEFDELSEKYDLSAEGKIFQAIAEISLQSTSTDADRIGARTAMELIESLGDTAFEDYLRYAKKYAENAVYLKNYRQAEQGYIEAKTTAARDALQSAESVPEIKSIIETLSDEIAAHPTNDELWNKEQIEFTSSMSAAYTYALTPPSDLLRAESYEELADIIDYYAFYQTSNKAFMRDTFRVLVDFPHNTARYTVNEVYWYCELLRSAVGINAYFEEDSSQLVITLTPYALASKSNLDKTPFYKRHDSVISFAPSASLTARTEDFEAFPYLDLYAGRYVEVWNSQQLWYALEHEYIPLAAKGSPAEAVLLRAKDILREIIKEGMTQEEKIFAIYSWYADNVSYDHKYEDYLYPENRDTYPDSLAATLRSFHAEGALLEGLAVCCSYAKSALILMRIEGIEAYRVILHSYSDNEIGNHGESGFGSHAIIALKGTDGKFYYCDVEQSCMGESAIFEKYHQLLVTAKEQWPYHDSVDRIYSDLDYAEKLPIDSFWSKLEYRGTSVVIKTEAQLRELINKFKAENDSTLQLTVFDARLADFDVKAILDQYTDMSLHQFSFGDLTEYVIYKPMNSYKK